MKLKFVCVVTFLLFIFNGLFPQTPPQPEPAMGSSLDDKNNNGITDAFEASDVNAPDSTGPGSPVDEIKRREGHLNLHGEHGKELDRGASPHAH